MNDKFDYNQYAAFINREEELEYLRNHINKEPQEILFLHGPKSSGKTTLLYKFLEEMEKKQKLDVKFLNLREKWIGNYKDFIRIFFGVDHSKSKGDIKEKREYSIFNFFKLSVEVLKGMEIGELDPFEIMKVEFIKLRKKGIKPVVIIDELQALDEIYMNGGKDRLLIIELFNFFVAMTKESHLAHIIISSSDGYFINRVFTDSRLKKTSGFYKVDYLDKADVIEWLLNIEKYSGIKDLTLTEEDVEKIWDVVGGSMWEIQYILPLFIRKSLVEVLAQYKRKMQGLITDYIVTKGRKKREKVLRVFVKNDCLMKKDIHENDEEILQHMVRNNILYFDPTEAVYYPQGRSYRHGIILYFESIRK